MKTVYFNNEQLKLIRESIENQKKIDSLSFLVSNCPYNEISENSIKRILLNGYNDAVSCFSDDITSFDKSKVIEKINKLIRICKKKEEPIREQLEKLCADLVTSVFSPSDKQLTLSTNLVSNIPSTKQFHIKSDIGEDYEYDSIESRDGLEVEKEKRRYVNTLNIGASLYLTDVLLKRALSDIFEMDEELPHLYSKIVKINNYLLYINNVRPTDEQHLQSAYEEVTLDTHGEKVTINVAGLIFPFLLTETIRAFIEVLSANALPENSKDANLIINSCDVLEDEPFYMAFGYPLWKSIVSNSELEPEQYEMLFKILFSLDGEKFTSVLKELLEGTKLGKERVLKLISQAKHDSDYQSFEKDLQKKREENNLIIDEYMTEEELLENSINEAEYPSSFNMEEFKQLKSFNARVKYCKERLKYLGKGFARIVFQIDNGTVLKLAYNEKGIGQNESDARVKTDQYLQGYNFLPYVYDVDDDYLWIEMQMARRAKKSDFKRLTGYGWDVFYYWVVYCWNNSVAYRNEQRHIPDDYRVLFNSNKWRDALEYSLFSEIEDYIGNYDVRGWGDVANLNSWGVVIEKNGEENLVLIDNGLDNDVLDKYYR